MALRREIEIKSQENGPVKYKLGPARLYLDDLQLIYDTLFSFARKRSGDSADTNSVHLEIKVGDAVADEIDDLRDARPAELRNVRISLRDPLVTVSLRRSYADLWAASTDIGSQELAAGIRDYVKGRRSLLSAMRSTSAMYVGSLFLYLVTVPNAFLENRTYIAEDIFAALIAFTVFLALAVGGTVAYGYKFGAVRIVPRKENEVRGIGSETRKQLLIALAGAIIGALIIAAAGLWAGVYVHH